MLILHPLKRKAEPIESRIPIPIPVIPINIINASDAKPVIEPTSDAINAPA
jgi:hypothetical protein